MLEETLFGGYAVENFDVEFAELFDVDWTTVLLLAKVLRDEGIEMVFW